MKHKKLAAFLVTLSVASGIMLKKYYFENQQELGVPGIQSIINQYTSEKSDIRLTIGVMDNDQRTYAVFGNNGQPLDKNEYEYEIGSLSKTFTTSLLCKAINEHKVELKNSIADYLTLNSNDYYPSILSLATHTSGYGDYPFDEKTLGLKRYIKIENQFYKRHNNIYKGFNFDRMVSLADNYTLQKKNYKWHYSNFGMGLVGTTLTQVYQSTTFKELILDFIKNDLHLKHTRVGDGTGDFPSYWDWNDDDMYIATGGLVSTVNDLLDYAYLHLSESPEYLALSHKEYQDIPDLKIRSGLGWMIDNSNQIIWHNGGTSSFTCFLGFDQTHQTATVILANYAAKDDTKEDGMLDTLGYVIENALATDPDSVFDYLNN